MKNMKLILWAVFIACVVCLSLMLVYNFIIADNDKGKSSDIEQVTKKPVSYDDGKTNSSIISQDSILSNLPPDTIYSFFGKRLIQNDSVIEQIASIAKMDKMLSYRDSILQICNVKWRINLSSRNHISLYTSVSIDDPRMEQVIKYLDKIYGKPYDVCDRKWSSSTDSLDLFKPGCTLVMMRRVICEDGETCGTFLTF